MVGYINNIYISTNRTKYLKLLSKQYNLDIDIIIKLSNILGTDEDVDGLIGLIEDYKNFII